MKSKAEKFVKIFGEILRRKKYKGRYKTMANQKGKSKYTRAQKRAYYSGMGYATASRKKGINFDNPENEASFKAGLKQGVAMLARTPDKYPPIAEKLAAQKKSKSAKVTPKKSRGKKSGKSATTPTVVVEVKQ